MYDWHGFLLIAFVAALLEGKMKRNDEERQKMLIDELISKVIPAFLDMMQKVLEDNGGKYIVGTDVSYKQLFTYIYIYIYIYTSIFSYY